MYKKRYPKFVFYVVVSVVLAIICVGWWQGSRALLTNTSGLLIAIGRLTGLLATFSILLELVLVGRLPYIEESFDLEESLDLHRLNGYLMLASLSAHIIFTVIGYGYGGKISLVSEFVKMNQTLEDVLWATIGTIVFFIAVGLSVKIARKKLPYQLWWLTHLTMYGAILLTFLHQVSIGGDVVAHKWFGLFWYGIYAAVGGALLIYRFIRPFFVSFKYQLRVDSVVSCGQGTYSIYISGKNVRDFRYKPGQYANWWFLGKGLWYEGHPFSFSSHFGVERLRITVKASGNHTAKLVNVRPGTPVLLDGPRGSFTSDRARGQHATLVAGGIGIAPFIPIAHSLRSAGTEVDLYYSVRDENELSLVDDLKQLQARGVKVYIFKTATKRRLDVADLVPHLRKDSSVFLCGPDSLSHGIEAGLKRIGFPRKQIISERFMV